MYIPAEGVGVTGGCVPEEVADDLLLSLVASCSPWYMEAELSLDSREEGVSGW